jgi:hypothetical protein
MAAFAEDTAVMAIREYIENSTRKLQSAVNKVAIWTKNGEQNSTYPNRYIFSQTRRLDKTNLHQWYTSSMCQNRKISLRLLIQSYGGRSTLKKTR